MNVAFLNQVRTKEVREIITRYDAVFRDKKILEVGGGTGVQAVELEKVAAELVSVDIADSNLKDFKNEKVTVYDGHHIPFPDNYFDVVYSSNVLEHIAHRDAFQRELQRVVRTDGYAVHVLPTHWWRARDMLQSILFFLPRLGWRLVKRVRGVPVPRQSWLECFFGARHGEFGNLFTELYHFMPRTWRRHFVRLGWRVEAEYPGEFLYTGMLLCGEAVPWGVRRVLARCFGSTVHIFVLQRNEVTK